MNFISKTLDSFGVDIRRKTRKTKFCVSLNKLQEEGNVLSVSLSSE